jgi:TatD DNase family protein
MSVDDALAAAAAVGVTRLVQIGCDLPSARWSVDVAVAHPHVVAGVALHPNEAPRIAAAEGRAALDAAYEEIDALAARTGTRDRRDRHGLLPYRARGSSRAGGVVPPAHRDGQAARKALVIHDRDSHDAVLRVLEDEGAPERVVFHCFSGDAAWRATASSVGWVLSFAGTVTFKNAEPAARGPAR